MKYSIAALALLAASFAGASSLDEIPTCAQSATQAGISATGCAGSDFACICGNSQFVTSLHNLIEEVCSAADQQVTLAFATEVCKAVGVSLNIPTASTTSSSVIPATTGAAAASSAIASASTTSSASSYATIPTQSAPYAFANGSTSINGTNSTIPFTGDAAERRVMGFQLAGSALSIAVVMGFFL